MLGHLASLVQLVGTLQKHGVENYAITELVQGQTRRWVLGWSLGDVRLPDVSGA
jgi:methyltransferase